VASLLRRARVSRKALVRTALWASAIGGSVALIFVPLQGVPASAFFLLFAGLVALRYRVSVFDALPLAIGLVAGGLAVGIVPFRPIREAADGIVTCAVIMTCAVILTALVPLREGAPGHANARAGELELRARIVAFPAAALAGVLAFLRRADDVTWRRIWVGGAGAAVLLVVLIGGVSARGPAGWKLVGGPDGAAVWNASFLETAMQRDAGHLRDPEVATADGSPPRVGIADSPLLIAAKLVFPARWSGPEIANLLAVLDLTALLCAAVWFVAALAGTSGGAAIAIVLAVAVSPLLRQVGATAPFDLWPALAVATLAMRGPSRPLVAVGVALGLLNVAGGYELAVLALGLGLAGRLAPRFAWAIGAAGATGSLVGGFISRALAPDATTLAIWWSSNTCAHLIVASGIVWPWALALLALAIVCAGWYWSLRKRDRAVRDAGIAVVAAGVLAIPGLLGGVPLLVPTRLLDMLPMGWPSARILAVAIVLLVVPVAAAIRLVVGRADGLRPPLRALAFLALVVAGLTIGRPTAVDLMLPLIPVGSDAVELPIAESGSRASFMFTDELLERGARISQPIPYVAVPTLLPGDDSVDHAIALLRKARGPAFVVVRLDVYADPAQRFAQPTVIDAADYAVPGISSNFHATLTSLTDQARVYQLAR
jgi:hypothetical protein